MTVMRGSEAITQTMKAHDVELVVGLTGHSVQEFTDTLYEEDSIRTFHVRNEMSGAHLINAYNKMKGRAAAAAVWHTCGSLVAPVGVYDALFDRIPSVHVAMNCHSYLKDRDAMQEIPNTDVYRSLAKWTTRVEKTQKIPETIHKAFQIAQSNPAGPVMVDIPFDLTVDKADMTIPKWTKPFKAGTSDTGWLEPACKLLLEAKKPVLMAGGGTVAADAGPEVKELAELLGMPVSTSMTGKGIFPEDHPLSLGSNGTIGWRCSNQYIPKADVVLAVGIRFSEWGYSQEYAADLPGKLIHVDVDAKEVGRFWIPSVGIVGDAKGVLRQIIDYLKPRVKAMPFDQRPQFGEAKALREAWLAEIEEKATSNEQPINPYRVVREIQNVVNEDDIIVADVGSNTAWVFQSYIGRHPKTNIFPTGVGSLGTGLPSAIGVKLARPDKNVVCVHGDGGFHYCIGDLGVAMQEKTPLTIVILKDGYYGANRGIAQHLFDERYMWVKLNDPDFVGLAKAFGGDGETVEDPRQLNAAIKRGVNSGTVYLIEAVINHTYGYPGTGFYSVRWDPITQPNEALGLKFATNHGEK